MTHEPRTLTRRSVAKGTAWAAPALAVGASAPAMAASPSCASCTTSTMGGGSGALSYWSASGGVGTWTKGGISVTFTPSMVSGTALALNGTNGTAATGLAGGKGIGDSSTMNGYVLNIQGSASVTPLEMITITFSKPVCSFQMYMRDVSWYSSTSGASDRDAVYWGTTPTSVASYLGTGSASSPTPGVASPNGAIVGTGSAASKVMRSTCCGTVPNGNGYYYDLQANWTFAAPTSSLTMYYTNGTGPSTAQMYMQIRDLAYCIAA